MGEAPKRGRPKNKKRKNKKTKKTKHFFLGRRAKEEYVIRNEDIVYFYICNSKT